MTIVEAVKALNEGKKIRRNTWEKGDYVTLKDNKVVTIGDQPSGLDIEDFSENCWEEYKEPVLDEKEKEYLSAVIKPFRDRITYIAKVEEDIHWFYWIIIRVDIGFLNDYYDFCLPPFEETSSMYKKMEAGKEYTLKELGL